MTHNQYPLLTQLLLHQRLSRMASCGPPPPRAAATPGAAAIHAAATPSFYRAKITPVQGVIFGRRLPTLQQQQSSSPFDIDTHEDERRCNFRSEDVPYLGLLHEVAPAIPSAGRTRARASCCLRRRDGKDCRLCAHNGAKALIRHLHKASYSITHTR